MHFDECIRERNHISTIEKADEREREKKKVSPHSKSNFVRFTSIPRFQEISRNCFTLTTADVIKIITFLFSIRVNGVNEAIFAELTCLQARAVS